jgi:hypothetical protein
LTCNSANFSAETTPVAASPSAAASCSPVMMSVGAGEARMVIAAPVDEAAVGLPRSIAGLMSQ